MTNGMKRFFIRRNRSKEWSTWFKKEHGREPTKEEGKAFGHGFNIGWKEASKRATKLLKKIEEKWEETCEIVSNPEILEGLKKSLEDFREGRYTVLTKKDAQQKKAE